MPRVVCVAVTGERGSHDGAGASAEVDDALVVDDLLVEDVSIDGMCGVY
jgi:mycofactocin precursor